jgi:hypothetical protein
LEKAFENTKDPDRKKEIEDLLKKARKKFEEDNNPQKASSRMPVPVNNVRK